VRQILDNYESGNFWRPTYPDTWRGVAALSYRTIKQNWQGPNDGRRMVNGVGGSTCYLSAVHLGMYNI
jgi:hypothetical protein